MSTKRITAIVPTDLLRTLEEHLRHCGVPGVTVEHVRGYGKHPNYFRHDLMRDNVRVVLYADTDKVEEYVAAIQACANECDTHCGVLTVESIDRLIRLSRRDADTVEER